TPTTAPQQTATAAPATRAPTVKLAEAPREWQLMDESADRVPGISADRAMKELLAGKAPKRTVLVAIIDNGIDTSHVDLKANLWVNPKATGAGDVHGWNFIGGRDGQDVHWDTFEVTRE